MSVSSCLFISPHVCLSPHVSSCLSVCLLVSPHVCLLVSPHVCLRMEVGLELLSDVSLFYSYIVPLLSGKTLGSHEDDVRDCSFSLLTLFTGVSREKETWRQTGGEAWKERDGERERWSDRARKKKEMKRETASSMVLTPEQLATPLAEGEKHSYYYRGTESQGWREQTGNVAGITKNLQLPCGLFPLHRDSQSDTLTLAATLSPPCVSLGVCKGTGFSMRWIGPHFLFNVISFFYYVPPHNRSSWKKFCLLKTERLALLVGGIQSENSGTVRYLSLRLSQNTFCHCWKTVCVVCM